MKNFQLATLRVVAVDQVKSSRGICSQLLFIRIRDLLVFVEMNVMSCMYHRFGTLCKQKSCNQNILM